MLFRRLLNTISPFENVKRYTFIEGMRGISVLMVFMVHFLGQFHTNNYNLSTDSPLAYIVKMFHSGHIGVDCFFILSGFLIYQVLAVSKKKKTFTRFILKRYIRLLPVIIAVVIIPSLVYINTVKVLIDNIFFLRLFPSLPYLSYVTWSLTYEIYFYILAGIWFISLPTKIAKSWWFIFFMYGIILLFPLFFETLQIPQPTRFAGFIWGIALGKLVETNQVNSNWLNKINSLIFLVGVLLILFMMFGWINFGWATLVDGSLFAQTLYYLFIHIGFFLILLSCFNNAETKGANFLSSYSLRYLGTISYSFYMIHPLCIEVSKNILSQYLSGIFLMIAQFPFSLILTMLFSHFLYYYLEKPYFESSKIKKL